MAWATDPQNEGEIEETRKFLNDTVEDKSRFITTFKARSGDLFVWGSLTLDGAGLKKVQAYPNVKNVMVEPEAEKDSEDSN